MWTIIKEQDFPQFIRSHQYLEDDNVNIVLQTILINKIKYFLLPRLFKDKYKNTQLLIKINNKKFKETVLSNVKLNTTLLIPEKSKEQYAIIEVFKNKYKNTKNLNGIIKAFPGFGKTVVAMLFTCIFKLKTIIIINNTELKNQWLDTYLKFTNLNENDIGLIQGSTIELNKPVIIATVQSLNSKIKKDFFEFYKTISASGIGLVFYDELHRTACSTKFASTSLLFDTNNIIGLSATPPLRGIRRSLSDGIFNEVVYETINYNLLPEVNYINFFSGLKKNEINRLIMLYNQNNYIYMLALYNKVITTDKKYLNVIYNIVKQSITNNETILIIVSTKKQVDTIQSFLKKQDIMIGKKLYAKSPCTMDKENDKLIIATLKKAGEGYDNKYINNVLIASPYKGRDTIIQLVGRILRTHKQATTVTPKIYDLIDNSVSNIFVDTIKTKIRILKSEFAKYHLQINNITI